MTSASTFLARAGSASTASPYRLKSSSGDSRLHSRHSRSISGFGMRQPFPDMLEFPLECGALQDTMPNGPGPFGFDAQRDVDHKLFARRVMTAETGILVEHPNAGPALDLAVDTRVQRGSDASARPIALAAAINRSTTSRQRVSSSWV